MPLQTFENLSDDRKKEIINICLREFAVNDFESASLSRIIKNLGLAKGSFYRYFENKTALYKYLFEFCSKIIYKQIDLHLKNPRKDFFDSWMDYAVAIFRVEKEYPMYFRFLQRIAMEKGETLLIPRKENREERRFEFFKDLIIRNQKNGSIRDDLDVDALTIYSVQLLRDGMRQYFYRKYHLDFKELSSSPMPIFTVISEEALRKDLTQFIKMMKRGIGSQKNKALENDN